MGGLYGMYLDTIGMEYESIMLDRSTVSKLLQNNLSKFLGHNWRHVNITRDASTEFFAEQIKIGSQSRRVSIHTKEYSALPGAGRNDRITMGFELFTNPLEVPTYTSIVYPLFNVLKVAGDATSHRASIHYHVGFVNNLRFLKNYLRMCLNLEPIFFRLGGMGGVHRGFENRYNYCRPLMNAAVVPVLSSSRKTSNFPEHAPTTIEEAHAQQEIAQSYAAELSALSGKYKQVRVANPIAALGATTPQQFWASFGIDYVPNIGVKYHPVRYSGFNFFSLIAHGTMEARHFNQSLDAPLVVGVGKFYRIVVELSTVISKDEIQRFDVLDPFQEVSVSASVEVMERILSLAYQKDIENVPSEREMRIIYETIENSSVKPISPLPVRTHIGDFVLDPYVANLGNLQEVTGDVAEPCQVDIHNISYQSIYDSGDVL